MTIMKRRLVPQGGSDKLLQLRKAPHIREKGVLSMNHLCLKTLLGAEVRKLQKMRPQRQLRTVIEMKLQRKEKEEKESWRRILSEERLLQQRPQDKKQQLKFLLFRLKEVEHPTLK